MKEFAENLIGRLEEKFKYNSEQAEIYRSGSDKDAYFREKEDLYRDRANTYGEVMRIVNQLAEEHKQEPYANYETVRSDRLDCEVPSDCFEQIKEVRVIDEWTEEEKVFKEEPKELCIATVKINKEDMQEIVDQKAKEIELDVQTIRNKTIDEFVERLKGKVEEKLSLQIFIDEDEFLDKDQVDKYIDEIAEQLKIIR